MIDRVVHGLSEALGLGHAMIITGFVLGFNLPWWDRLLGTYQAQPRSAHEDMEIGIPKFRDPKQCPDLPRMLAIPLV